MTASSRNRDTEAVLRYHEETKHSERSVRESQHFLDFSNQPLAFKMYRDVESVRLVDDLEVLSASPATALDAVVAGAATADRAGTEVRPDLATLSRVLCLAASITKRKRHSGGKIYFRAYPNTGALYHIDLYVVTADLPGLPAGVYQFGPHDFALHRLRAGDHRGVLVDATGAHPWVAEASVTMASASTYWRNAWKYQARTWRHCFWDSGTLHANLLAATAAEGLRPQIIVGFADPIVDALLGLDPAREAALTLVTLGHGGDPPPPAPPLPPLAFQTEPLSRSEVDYPAIPEAHAASSLDSGNDAATWRGKTPEASPVPARGRLVPLRPMTDDDRPCNPLAQVVFRRGSTRVFDRARALGFEAFSTLLDVATRGVPADFLEPPGRSLVDLYLIVNAVDGLTPGAYFYRRDARALEMLAEGDFRELAGRLALGQPLGADAAVNVYSLCALAPILERYGNRGYRAAQFEGGVIGGSLYLVAYALGFGASGLTFFDDEVTEFFSPHAADKSVMFLTALGYADRAALR